jgi:hypothetical protein
VSDGFLTDDVADQVRLVLRAADRRERMVTQNYEAARRFFSHQRAETELRALLAKP